MKLGCRVTFLDCHESLRAELRGLDFRIFAVGKQPLSALGQYDLVLFSNVYEHLPDPGGFLREVKSILSPGGVMFLSWTNWLSPWGGHDFSPFHYLGPRLGPWVFDRLRPGKRVHQPFAGLWPTYIGRTIRQIRKLPDLQFKQLPPGTIRSLRG